MDKLFIQIKYITYAIPKQILTLKHYSNVTLGYWRSSQWRLYFIRRFKFTESSVGGIDIPQTKQKTYRSHTFHLEKKVLTNFCRKIQ